MIALEATIKRMRDWRHQLHKHPETAYTEFKTAKLVTGVLTDLGLEVHTDIAVTGVVGVLRRGNGGKSIALRADMDALDIQEENTFSHRSRVTGKMHACGHDGHTAMLLGAAEYLSKHGQFDGTVYFIFQPAEENEGGAAKMIEEGLFHRFPADAIYGMHNMPMLPTNNFAIRSGSMMAAFATFECVVNGTATHSSMPSTGNNAIYAATAIVDSWRDYFEKYNSDDDPFVVATTRFHAGEAWNIIPGQATVGGSTRCFTQARASELEAAMSSLVREVSAKYAVRCDFTYNHLYPPLVNSLEETNVAIRAASSLVGEENVQTNIDRIMGSEDFAYMLKEKSGAYILIGNDGDEIGGCMVHNANYDFNDDILELGANYWITLVQQFLTS